MANDRVCEVFLYTQKELLDLNLSLILRGSESDALVRRAVCSGRVWHGEVSCFSRDESALWLLATIIPRFDHKMKCISHYVVTATDITHYKQTYQGVTASHQVDIIRQWVAGIAHEIRNPLTSIRGFLQLMQSKPGEGSRFLNMVLAEVDRIASILTEILSLGKFQTDVGSAADIQYVLAAITPLLSAQVALHNINLTIHVEADLPYVVCSESEIKQIILNIANNAIEAMPHGGILDFSIEKRGVEHVILRCLDNGMGMRQELLSKIASPFVTTKEGGTGLGLSICKSILASHGGHLDIHSMEGIGTTVEVVFCAAPKGYSSRS